MSCVSCQVSHVMFWFLQSVEAGLLSTGPTLSSLHTRSLCSMECSKVSTDAEATAWGDHGDGYRSGHGGG